jgi:tRNA-dihydrouridine synthase
MDGITDCSYRLICQEVFAQRGDPKHVFRTRTEFMNADGYLINPGRLIHHLMNTGEEDHLIAQIYGGNHEALLRCAIDIDQKYASGFQGLELNIGCPSPKVMSCGGGAGMLKEKAKTLEIIKTISKEI